MFNKLSLVVVIPAYNEEGCIENVIDLWTQGISKILKNENSDLNLRDFLYFFQEHYGDIFFLHPINYDILLAEYTDEQHLPTEITVFIFNIGQNSRNRNASVNSLSEK